MANCQLIMILRGHRVRDILLLKISYMLVMIILIEHYFRKYANNFDLAVLFNFVFLPMYSRAFNIEYSALIYSTFFGDWRLCVNKLPKYFKSKCKLKYCTYL